MLIPPAQIDRLFPFHMVFDREFRIVRMGPSLSRACPDAAIGADFRQAFRPLETEAEIDFARWVGEDSLPTAWEHQASKLEFRGLLMPIQDGQAIAALWSPCLSDITELTRHGLRSPDFAPHDPSVSLLQALQSQKVALQDERDLAEKLSEQRADLLQANAELSRQFSLLWEELVNLKQIEAETFKIALIANNTGNAVVMADALGRVEWVNDSFTQMTGYTLQEMIGKTPGSVLQGEKTDQAVVEYIRRQFNMGESFGAEILNYSKSGREYWVQFEVQPIRDEEDRITNWMAIERDITEQKQSELALLEAKRAAESASRAKSAFLATMSHEIRTPMNAVLGTLSLLLDSPLDKEQELWANSAYIAAQSLLNIIEDILDFSKIEAGKLTLIKENFDLESVISEVIQMFRIRTEGKGIGLYFNIAHDTPKILHGDMLRLKQILINLIGNAVKFTDNGKIEVNVCRTEQSETKVKLHFQVIDSGIGIPEEAQDSLFNQFVQVDNGPSRRYGGTGLGLAISKRLVKLMDGEIGVNSQLGIGSEFWFSVDMEPPNVSAFDSTYDEIHYRAPTRENNKPTWKAEEENGRVESDSEQRRKTAKILVAEDGEINRLVVTAMLEKAGYRVDVAKDGKKAVEAASLSDYDLILMDVQMPELDGYQATTLIRGFPGNKAQIPILAFTANALQEDRNACIAAGMNDFVAKPVEKDRLLATIANWLRKTTHNPLNDPPSVNIPQDLPILLDKVALKSLVEHTDEQTMKDTVHIFFADTTLRIARVEQALVSGNYQALGFEAHSIKSAAMTLGALRLATACQDIEEACSSGNLQAVELHAKQINGLFEITRMAFIEQNLLPDVPLPTGFY